MISLPQLPPLPPMPQIHSSVLQESAPEGGVQQNIRVYTSTGASTVSNNGVVREGTSTSHVQIQTVINGEKVTDINRTEVATESSAIEVTVKGTTSQVRATNTSPAIEKGLFKRFISYVFSFFPF